MSNKDVVKSKWLETISTAEKVDCWYVMCAFISPVTHDVSFRIAYFEERHDAEQWISSLVMRYKELNVPYYIRSNTVDYSIGDASAFAN